MSEDQSQAIDSLKLAVKFFDKARASTGDERTAAGTDYWEWLEAAARDVVKAF